MSDVAIIHAPDKRTAAGRLADAIGAAGFDVGAVEIANAARLADTLAGCESKARILVWSRPLVSHALHSGDLSRIRQLPGLIEVSADGITPPSRGDDSRVVLISGWRGQPFHPGWQRIHGELKRLCGARKAVAEAPPSPPSVSANPSPQRTASSVPGGEPRPRARLVIGAGIVVLLIAGAVGASTWLRSAAPDDRSRQESREARPSGSTGQLPRPGPGPESPSSTVPVSAPPAYLTPPSPSPERPATAEARPEPSRPAQASRTASPKPAVRLKALPSPQAENTKKYSRKYSKVMRQFCERSGRSTPQCRTFRRSIGEDGSPSD